MTDSTPPPPEFSTPPKLTAPPPVPTLNRTQLDAIAREASREFLVELAHIFTSDVEQRIRGLARIVQERDVSAAADAAHGVQSAAATLGVLRLRFFAASLERHAGDADWRRVELALERLESEFSHVKQLLEAMRKDE